MAQKETLKSIIDKALVPFTVVGRVAHWFPIEKHFLLERIKAKVREENIEATEEKIKNDLDNELKEKRIEFV